MTSDLPKIVLKDVACHFAILGDFLEAVPYGNGHINDTYAAIFDQGGVSLRCQALTGASGASPCSQKSSRPAGLRTRRISFNAATGSGIVHSV